MDGEKLKPDSMSSSGGRKTSEGFGNKDFAKESNITAGGENASGQNSGPALAEKVKDKAGKSSELASDAKDIANAKTGLETTGKEIKEGAQKDGMKGAAAAAGREAAGQAVGAAATALSAGALAEVQGKIAKGVSKALKKENLKKILIGIVAVIALPMMIIGIIVFIIFYAMLNPFEFMSKVITDSKIREFGLQAAESLGGAIIGSEDLYKKYGYIENKPGSVIAATPTTAPKPGSLEEKLLKVDIKKAQYQTGAAPDCPYKYKTKELVSSDGKKTNVIDKIYNRKGQEVDKNDFLASYCVMQSMPLYNMMVRTQDARDTNSFSSTVLNYADSTSAPNLKTMSKQERAKYVYNKTYDRITSKESDTPKTGIRDIDDYIDRVRDALAKGGNPDAIKYDFGTPDPGIEDTVKTLCTFTKGYLTTENIQKGIESRLYSGSRSGVKSNTLASTRTLGNMSNEELEPTYLQSENWQQSIAYSQDVHGSQGGTKIDPERLGNTAYGSGYSAALSLLYELNNQCKDYKSSSGWFGSFFGGLFGGDKQKAEENINSIYNSLREIIVAQSNGKFTSINSFGLEQLMIGVIRMGGGSAVSGLEGGAQNFNNQSQGYRSISNQYMMRIGGRFLTSEEYSKRSLLAENTRREIENKNGIAYRLFDRNNIRSLANLTGNSYPKTPNEVRTKSREIIASISNPLKLVANTHTWINYYAFGKNNQAFAADKTGDAYMRLNSVGLTKEDFKNVNLISNSNEIQNILEGPDSRQKQILSYFEKCSKSNMPSSNLFVRQYKVKINDDEVDVIQNEANVIKENTEGFTAPVYPAVGSNYQSVGFANKKEFIACEIYLNPKGKATQRDYNDAVQKQIFGQNITTLASKYHLYLYANKIADLMVELSNTEKTDSIYANGASSSSPTSSAGTSIVGDPYSDSTSVACADGTKDLGIFDAYKEGAKVSARLCALTGLLTSTGSESTPGGEYYIEGADGFAIVNSRVSGAWASLVKAARSAGITLRAASSFRTMAHQQALCQDNAGCRSGDNTGVAKPGYSSHQAGVAIDFALSGGTSAKSGRTCTNRDTRPDAEYQWLRNNASKFGFKQYANEAWHFDALDSESRCP